MVGSPLPFAASALGFDLRAAPATAVFTAGPPDDVVTIGFTQLLAGNPTLNLGNWFVRYANFSRGVIAADDNGASVVLTLDAGASDPGADVVTFTPPPFDVLTFGTLAPVLAFADFPIT